MFISYMQLASLQALNLFWLYCLLRSMYKFLVYRIKKDDRSESSGEEEEEGAEALERVEPPVQNGVVSGVEKPASASS